MAGHLTLPSSLAAPVRARPAAPFVARKSMARSLTSFRTLGPVCTPGFPLCSRPALQPPGLLSGQPLSAPLLAGVAQDCRLYPGARLVTLIPHPLGSRGCCSPTSSDSAPAEPKFCPLCSLLTCLPALSPLCPPASFSCSHPPAAPVPAPSAWPQRPQEPSDLSAGTPETVPMAL